MSIRSEIRKAGFPTELVGFTNTKLGTVASFPVMGATHGWHYDIPVADVLEIMQRGAAFSAANAVAVVPENFPEAFAAMDEAATKFWAYPNAQWQEEFLVQWAKKNNDTLLAMSLY